MPKAPKKRSPGFVPPPVGHVPANYRPTTHTSVRTSDFGASVDAEWTTYAKYDADTGAHTVDLPFWFTATCLVRNDRAKESFIRLRGIGAQANIGTLRLRVSGAKKPVMKLSKTSSGIGGRVVKAVGGFYPIEPALGKGGVPSDDFYTLSFVGPVCLIECYNTLFCEPKPRPPTGPVTLIEEGSPPPGTPQTSE